VLSFLNPVVLVDATDIGFWIGSLCCTEKRRLLATMITGTSGKEWRSN
jgi:hypothetical protein